MEIDKYFEAKKNLAEELGEKYPQTKKDISPLFLIKFADYLDGPNEDDYDDYKAYETDKYCSEQWNFLCRMNQAIYSYKDVKEETWDDFLDWFVENYFPELSK